MKKMNNQVITKNSSLNLSKTNKAVNLDDNSKRIYCGVEDSTCNMKLRFLNHSRCCLLCEHQCSNCTVTSVDDCGRLCSKKEIATSEIHKLKEEKKELYNRLEKINRKIKSIQRNTL